GSHALARARPDLVTLEVFRTARHTKLWNYDQERWSRAITEWAARLPVTPAAGGGS
ncbi:MAG TPA: alpha/beta hydrolase, partial [Microbacterium sp.]|nr:alpha/beta hydrolase [Microbacterium sp.]